MIKRFYCFQCKGETIWIKDKANYPYHCTICSLKKKVKKVEIK